MKRGCQQNDSLAERLGENSFVIPPEELAACTSVLSVERAAIACLPRSAGLYIGYGAENQESLRANRAGWDRCLPVLGLSLPPAPACP